MVHSDASPVGVAAVLMHRIKVQDGTVAERTVMFASCSLTATQQRYAQLDSEALAIIFAVNKIKKFVWVALLPWSLIINRLSIFSRLKSLFLLFPLRDSSIGQPFCRIFRTRLSTVKRSIYLLRTLFRACLFQMFTWWSQNMIILFLDLPVNVDTVVHKTQKDSVLSRILEFTLEEWPDGAAKDPTFTSYFKIRQSFSVENKCLLFANRVVIPLTLQKHVLNLLHEDNPGIVRMKLLARSVCWWLFIYSDIETYCQNCLSCSRVNFKPFLNVTYPWPKPKAPFERVYVDFDVFKHVTFSIYVDAFSK